MKNGKAWKKIDERYGYQGWRKILIRKFELPDGKTHEFDIIHSSSFATVASVTKEGKWIIVRQYRPGPEEFLTGFPEGAIDEDEAIEDAARRELLEETGYQAGRLIALKTKRRAYNTQTQYFLLALDCEKTSKQDLDESEFIEVSEWTTEQLLKKLRSSDDDFNNIAAAYIALDYLKLLGEG